MCWSESIFRLLFWTSSKTTHLRSFGKAMEEGTSRAPRGQGRPFTDALVAVVTTEHPLLQQIWEAIGLDAQNIEREEKLLKDELILLFKVPPF